MVKLDLVERKLENFPRGWVGYLKGKKGRVVYTTGIMTFSQASEEKKFISQIGHSKLTWIEVDLLKQATPPETKGRGYYCPYCRCWEYWKTSNTFGKICPICGITERDYYVRQYNHLWRVKFSNTELKTLEKRTRRK